MRLHKLTNQAVKRIESGEKLLRAEDFVLQDAARGQKEGTILQLVDENKRFVAKAFVSQQNKGLAWVFTQHEKIYFNEDFIDNCIEDAIELRASYFDDEETTAFRLFNGEGDGIGGVTIDWYAGFVQINWYTRAIYNEREWFVTVLKHYLPEIKGIYETKRFALVEGEVAIEHTDGEVAPSPIVILENNICYAIHLGEEWMTGLFLDQREVRRFIQQQAQDMSVLNLFSYTGGFSVAAAVGGAAKTVSVDVANRSLEKTQEQFELNGIMTPSDAHEIRVMDVFDYIQYAKRHQLQFDWVVCDPPSFARTKQYQFSVERDYQQLAKDLFDLTAVNGFCVISTNHSGYEKQQLIQDMNHVIQAHQGDFQLIQVATMPSDFPTSADEASQYLKVLIYYRVS
ncbi:class I SAM-dependent rRNA methyltransferase [Aerococcaceae bacterium zg-B36]|uniref:class I SAM-dependent rRNA methyltransferase n=1 Tax=Aerococcaceae bacterium zg-252 TaxID=2796928 RepID=UPI001BD89F28|nr:class I SAM-dependent rRNA methyltransferase [Aerococcaceae bacterium zg-B36]